ncbi:MAG: formate/nitrite transporter family protein [Eubacteriales bacterium]|nr:formate/nitrite transporter family protein [Eubacteriales bacterium]
MSQIHYQNQLKASAAKTRNFTQRRLAFSISAALAGFYIGLGFLFNQYIKLQMAGSAAAGLVSAVCFSIGLLLVIFAGADLFTGMVMTLSFGMMSRQDKQLKLVAVAAWAWLFNFVGSALLAVIFRFTKVGGAALDAQILHTVSAKLSLSIPEMISRGILCNVFVCLAVWVVSGLSSEGNKSFMSVALVAAFVALSFEHVVANMTIFTYAALFSKLERINLGVGPISLVAGLKSLFWVTVGNILGGWLFVALPYQIINTQKEKNAI